VSLPVDPQGYAMDALRSCYRTTMRFPGVGLVPIRWYWTDCPCLPVETVYNSHNHSRDKGWDDYDTGAPGEVWSAARTYDRGIPPPGFGCGQPQGSQAAWLGQSDENSPLYPVGVAGYEYDEGYDNSFFSANL
jgi:hypothetical protein